MPQPSLQTQELKDWLEENKFGQFFEKMYDVGVEQLDDLRALRTENDVIELAGPSGINMGIIFRRKFIRAVLSLSESDVTSPTASTPTQTIPTENSLSAAMYFLQIKQKTFAFGQ
ncbi:hypothetical protein RFI_20227 [Reticulomyxa filosa]|uniref:SAM domain-containing protein n=1 Tax=Reticulomyxa filosa TaxID=46433 RepID=X6MVH3_RETFI|nr:hypothetical protein RFI_20227 [Reticulomyxa filosa]|eukprot:ETO17105.1 hypothetical protein RFI_20227 [Reticulomyxa filosa]